jgi:hypothetical protein
MNQDEHHYSQSFYDAQSNISFASACQVVPHVLEMTTTRSVVDYGCGVGTWLQAFENHGVSDLVGFEGEWVQKVPRRVKDGVIQVMDLNQARPTERIYDLAISLEVAEHLNPEGSANFVAALCASAPVILFSAAIPQQGGTNHINCQWQDFWAELFQQNGYDAYDVIRPKIVHNKDVASYYRQNIIMYAKRGKQNLIQAESKIWTLNYVLPDWWISAKSRADKARLGDKQKNKALSFKKRLKRAIRVLRGKD